MEELRKEGRGESQKEGSPAQRPVEGEEGKGREGEGLVEGASWGSSAKRRRAQPHVPEAICSTGAKIPE